MANDEDEDDDDDDDEDNNIRKTYGVKYVLSS